MVAIKYTSVDLLMWTFQSLEKVPPPQCVGLYQAHIYGLTHLYSMLATVGGSGIL